MNSKLLIFTIFSLFWHQILSASPGTSESVNSVESSSAAVEILNREEALKHYQAKDFTRSIGITYKLIETEGESADLYYNLFINYYAANQVGKGLHSLRKSLELSPSYKYSLNAMRQLKKEWKTRMDLKRSFFSRAAIQLHYIVNVHILVWVFLISLSLCFRLAIKLFKQLKNDSELSSGHLGFVSFSFLVLIFAGAALGAKLQKTYEHRATSIAESNAKVTPNTNSPDILLLKEGEEVIVKEKKQDWYRIEDLQGTQAWIEASNILFSTKEI